jgi:hypothetical protein
MFSYIPSNKNMIMKGEKVKIWKETVIYFTAYGFLSGGRGKTKRYNKQITHITQNNITIKRDTAHKTTHTIKDTLHRMNTNHHNYNDIN